MSDLRTSAQMILDARHLADLENALTRFPDPEVLDYCNRGRNRVYAELLEVFDQPFNVSQSPPIQIATTPTQQATGALVALPLDFMQMVALLWSSGSSGPWYPCEKIQDEQERAALLVPGFMGGVAWRNFRWAMAPVPFAVTQGTDAVTYSIELLPPPPVGSYVIARYVPSLRSLVNTTDTVDGILGFYDAATCWAAILMRRKDDLETAALEADFAQHVSRIHAVAKRRDRSRPPRESIVRGWGAGSVGRHLGRRW